MARMSNEALVLVPQSTLVGAARRGPLYARMGLVGPAAPAGALGPARASMNRLMADVDVCPMPMPTGGAHGGRQRKDER
jgi:hypothetical protein